LKKSGAKNFCPQGHGRLKLTALKAQEFFGSRVSMIERSEV
jgi:hypothetical protein